MKGGGNDGNKTDSTQKDKEEQAAGHDGRQPAAVPKSPAGRNLEMEPVDLTPTEEASGTLLSIGADKEQIQANFRRYLDEYWGSVKSKDDLPKGELIKFESPFYKDGIPNSQKQVVLYVIGFTASTRQAAFDFATDVIPNKKQHDAQQTFGDLRADIFFCPLGKTPLLTPKTHNQHTIDGTIKGYNKLLEQGYDPKNIYFAGTSQGAYAAAAAAKEIEIKGEQNAPAGVVMVTPVLNFQRTKIVGFNFIPGFRMNQRLSFNESIPEKTPVFTIHGGEDYTWKSGEMEKTIQDLKEKNNGSDGTIVPNRKHGMISFPETGKAIKKLQENKKSLEQEEPKAHPPIPRSNSFVEMVTKNGGDKTPTKDR